MVARKLNISNILAHKSSFFIFGARGTGKSYLLNSFIQSAPDKRDIVLFDLLQTGLYQRYLRSPSMMASNIEQRIKKVAESGKALSDSSPLMVIIDEVQKIPLILDEVHRLIEKYQGKLIFVLTGSSARKLKRGAANLLAGRAISYKMHPLTTIEIPDLDLVRALSYGTLPAIYLHNNASVKKLTAYVDTYLREEIFEESLVRGAEQFIRFLDIAGQCNGKPVNFSSIAAQAGVAPHTVENYFSILEDTLIAFRLNGWNRSPRKQLLLAPRYYFFDCGVLNAVRHELRSPVTPGSNRYGKLFETFIIQEFFRLNDYLETGYQFYYWRTKDSQEVDLLLSRGPNEPLIAVEIKSSERVTEADLSWLRMCAADQSPVQPCKMYCISGSDLAYEVDGVPILPWRTGVQEILLEEQP